jgi:hypothetical protein
MYYPYELQTNHLLRATSVTVLTKLIIKATIQKYASGLVKDADGCHPESECKINNLINVPCTISLSNET